MKYCRFELNGSAHYGLVESVAGNDEITRLLLQPPQDSEGDAGLPSSPHRPHPARAGIAAAAGAAFEDCLCRPQLSRACRRTRSRSSAGAAAVFQAALRAAAAGRQRFCGPKCPTRTDYEGELGVVIGRRCHLLADSDDVRPYILGYTCVNDFTARDLQNKDGQWTRAKGFDTFCPVGPLVADGLDPWAGVQVETRVNGEVRQSGNTRDFIFPLDVVIRYISQVMTLEPGDLIATGTPKGVGPVVAGDAIEVSIAGIGQLRNSGGRPTVASFP